MAADGQLFGSDDSGGVVLRGMRCAACGHVAFPEQAYGCERCGATGAALEPLALPARGVLTSHAVVHLHPAGGITPPFVIGEVRLASGPSVRMTMVEPACDAPVSGMPVAGVLYPAGEGDDPSAVELRFARLAASAAEARP